MKDFIKNLLPELGKYEKLDEAASFLYNLGVNNLDDLKTVEAK